MNKVGLQISTLTERSGNWPGDNGLLTKAHLEDKLPEDRSCFLTRVQGQLVGTGQT